MKTKLISALLVLAAALTLCSCAEASYSQGEQQLPAFSSLQLECAAAGVRIEYGSAYAIKWQVQGELSVQTEGDTLIVKQRRPAARYEDGDWSIVVTLPQNAALDSLSLGSAAGEIAVNDICAQRLDIVCAAGSVNLCGMTVDEAAISISAGELFYSGSLGNAELSVAAGDAELQLLGDPAACYVDANVAVGHLWTDERTAYSAEDAQYVITADVAAGDFKLMFP